MWVKKTAIGAQPPFFTACNVNSNMFLFFLMPERFVEERRGGRSCFLRGDDAGAVGFTPGIDALGKSFSHLDRVSSFGDGGVQEHGVISHLHGGGGVRRGADPGVDHQCFLRKAFA